MAEQANVASYETYFSTGGYDRRYPAPNAHVMRVIRRWLPVGGHLIDYGCGSGRYLMALRDRAATAAGFDVAEAALERLRARARAAQVRSLHLLGPDPDDVAIHVDRYGAADVILCLFGVLSHVEGREARRRVLEGLARLLRPETGRLVLSVPNRRRRFKAEQRGRGATGEIRYTRRFDGGSAEFSYKLYDPASLQSELGEAGLVLESLRAESVLPEPAIAVSPVLRLLDGAVAPFVPADLGYGLLAVVRPASWDARGDLAWA